MPSQIINLKAARKRLAVLEELYVVSLNGGFANYVDKKQIPSLQNIHNHYQAEAMLQAFNLIPENISKTTEEVRMPFEIATSKRNKKDWEVRFNDPEFENVYESTKKLVDDLSKGLEEITDLERAKVTYSNGTISQGSNRHSFKNEDFVRLLNYLWAKRVNSEHGGSISSRRIPRSKVEIELGFGSVKRLNGVIDASNREVRKKGINVMIRRAEGCIYLEIIDVTV